MGANSTGIVIGLDGSRASIRALRWAIIKSQELGVVLDVVHCWSPDSLPEAVYWSFEELRTSSAWMLANEVEVAQAMTGSSAQVITSSVRGRPTPTLLKRARSARMLVLGAHGFGLRDLVLGSTADQCRKKAPCPVVIIDVDGREVPAGERRRTRVSADHWLHARGDRRTGHERETCPPGPTAVKGFFPVFPGTGR